MSISVEREAFANAAGNVFTWSFSEES